MPALPSYIPARDADLDNWSSNFDTLITASPPTYGLVAGDATAIATAVSAWHTAYLLAISPSTRTPSTVADKDTQKILMLATCRPYAQAISLNAGVSSMDKIAVGVNPRTSVPAPITTPTTYPALTIDAALTLQHVLRYRDQLASPTVKAKPYGVISCQIFGNASNTPIVDPTVLMLQQNTAKCPLLIAWQSADAGKTAYYAARWVTRSGLVGPYGPIVSMTIAA